MRARGTGRTLARADLRVALSIACSCLVLPAVSIADFGDFGGPPGTAPGPNESVRLKTPNDPGFDRCEPDDEDNTSPECSNVFSEQFERFGFAPASTQTSALYQTPTDPHTMRL